MAPQSKSLARRVVGMRTKTGVTGYRWMRIRMFDCQLVEESYSRV